MKARIICLVRRHQWHNGWDDDGAQARSRTIASPLLHTRTAPRAEPPPCAPWSPVPQGHSSFVATSSQERAQSRIGSVVLQSRTWP